MDVQQTLSIIEHQEQVLVFDAFDNHDALLLGMRLAEQVKESERPVAIRIYLGDVLVFQYTMQGKEEWHYGWAEKKCQM
ncbi:MAG: heme-binding protein [Selenomonadaceae bacterium]|nr:heme-binding protein [Selenomonadaceae bacterium]